MWGVCGANGTLAVTGGFGMTLRNFPMEISNLLAYTKAVARFRVAPYQTADIPFASTNKLKLGCCVT